MKLNPFQHIQTDHIVLLAEDDLDDQEMLIEAIKEQDPSFQFLVANTGSKALGLLKDLGDSQMPSLILLDYNLPEISGAEILAKLQSMKNYDEIIKVVWSTSNSPVYQKKCLELGACSYIVKPNGIDEIKDVAIRIIELSKKRA